MTHDNFVVEYNYLKKINEVLNECIWLVSLQSHYKYKPLQMTYFIFYLFVLIIVDYKN